MKALEIVRSPRLSAKTVCQTKQKLFWKSPDMDLGEAPAPGNHCGAVPWEAAAGPCSSPGLEPEPGQGLPGNRFRLGLRKLVRAADRRPVLTGEEPLGMATEMSL